LIAVQLRPRHERHQHHHRLVLLVDARHRCPITVEAVPPGRRVSVELPPPRIRTCDGATWEQPESLAFRAVPAAESCHAALSTRAAIRVWG